MWSLAGIFVWKWTGITMIYWLAALQTVPDELYEAAKLDGMKGWQDDAVYRAADHRALRRGHRADLGNLRRSTSFR